MTYDRIYHPIPPHCAYRGCWATTEETKPSSRINCEESITKSDRETPSQAAYLSRKALANHGVDFGFTIAFIHAGEILGTLIGLANRNGKTTGDTDSTSHGQTLTSPTKSWLDESGQEPKQEKALGISGVGCNSPSQSCRKVYNRAK